MNFTEEYRRKCNPNGYTLLDVMLGARGRTRADARRLSSTPSTAAAHAILFAVVAATVAIVSVAIWRFTR